jgi:hypothetical protein
MVKAYANIAPHKEPLGQAIYSSAVHPATFAAAVMMSVSILTVSSGGRANRPYQKLSTRIEAEGRHSQAKRRPLGEP